MPVAEVGRAIGPCSPVGVSFAAGATGRTGSCTVLGEFRCKKAGRRETGDGDRVIVTFPPSRFEIWSKDGSDDVGLAVGASFFCLS